MKRILPQMILGLVGLMIVWLAAATVVEKIYGSGVASAVAYRSAGFFGLWAVIAVLGLVLCVKRKLHRRPMAFAIHIALLVILVGAGATWLWATSGKMYLVEGNEESFFELDNGRKEKLPFTIKLEKFDFQCYAETPTPSEFVASVTFCDNQSEPLHTDISLNHIGVFKGYRLCLSGFDENGDGIVLKVTHDPIGNAVTHVGYLMLLLAMIGYLFSKRTRFRTAIGQVTTKRALALMALAVPIMTQAAPRVLPKNIADDFGKLYLLHNERICPLETMARDVTLKLYGKTSYQGYDACQVVTGWLFYFEDWANEPMIKIKSAQVRQLLGTESKFVAMNDFYDAGHSYLLADAMTAPSKDVLEANEKCQVAIALGMGNLFKIMPLRHDATLEWYVPGSLDIPSDIDENKWAFMRNGLSYFNELVVAKDWENASIFIGKLKKFQEQEGGELLPSPTRTKSEIIYNHTDATLPCAIALMVMGLLSLALTVSNHEQFRVKKWMCRMLPTILVMAFVWLTFLLILRWLASGHLPMTNGYETMQLMAWCALLVTLLTYRRLPLMAHFGTLVAAFTLLVSVISQSNPAITPLMPVLNSPWLCIHVATVMMAYSLLAILTLNSILALCLRHKTHMTEQMRTMGLVVLFPAVFLLVAGIFIGAVWAGLSWGRYWAWDPKETWALITLLIYAIPLHDASLPKFQRPLFFHAYVAIAFVSVLFTYWGVNTLLGGLHSYG
ncbi:MAG: cytochrome c biogenesis protein CcsA [Muribaculaceae bacterium]|nr:cytochrome c biogenesis protein CcsA [Muribaculaceae bacterium]